MNKKEHDEYRKSKFTFDEAREIMMGQMNDRARYAGFMYKELGKEEFDKMGEVCFHDYGLNRTTNIPGKRGEPRTMADWITDNNGVGSACEWNELTYEDQDKCIVRFHGKCALVKGWEDMGLSREEVIHMCDVICYGDYGVAEGLGVKCFYNYTNADGVHDGCELVIERIKDK